MTTTRKTRESRESGPGPEDLGQRARALGLYGLWARLDEVKDEPWLETLLGIEEQERGRRSLERRLRNARLGRFKPMADFDWAWPKKIDRELVEEIFRAAKERNTVLTDAEVLEICKFHAAENDAPLPLDTVSSWKKEVEKV